MWDFEILNLITIKLQDLHVYMTVLDTCSGHVHKITCLLALLYSTVCFSSSMNHMPVEP